MKKSLFILPLLALTTGLLASCGGNDEPLPPSPPAHTHEYGTAWRCDSKNHWHECSCGAKIDVAAHVDSNKDGKCDVCNYNVPVPHEHKYGDEWKSDEFDHWHECSCGSRQDTEAHIDEDENGECDICKHTVPVFDPNAKLAPESFVDEDGKTHNRVSSLEDGGHYLLGYYRAYSGKMRFANAEPHKDEKGNEYPFYLGTGEESAAEEEFENVGEAAEIVVDFIPETNKFTMKYSSESGRYDGKYLSIYCADSAYGNQVYSFYLSSEYGAAKESEPSAQTSGQKCYYDFEMMDSYQVDAKHSYNLGVPVISFADDRQSEEEATPKFLGSGVDGDGVGYISIDCVNPTKAMLETYNLAFFYEA